MYDNNSTDSTKIVWIAIFDMDGVIFETKNFWLKLHQLFGTQKEALKLADQMMKNNYRLMAEITVSRLWKYKTAEPFWNLIKKSKYQSGIKKVFRFLKARGIKTAIVSSGPLQLAKRAQKELLIDEIRANEVIIENGILTSFVEVNVSENEKDKVGLDIIHKLGGSPTTTIFVGDSDSDISLAKVVGIPIAYNSESDELNKISKYTLAQGQLLELIEIIKSEMLAGSP